MKWKLFILAFILPFWVNAQDTLNKIEFWFDDDFAGRKIVSISDTQYTFDSLVSTTGLSTGMHFFNCRFGQKNLYYSSVFTKMFIKLPATNDTGYKRITAYEYWFDTAYNSKVADTLAADSNVHFVADLNQVVSTPGLHTLNIRFKDNGNVWSSVVSKMFIKLPATADNSYMRITRYEYWFDSAYAARVADTLSADSSLHFITDIKRGSISNGLHTLNVRFKDNSDLWSSTVSKLILVYQGSSNSVSTNVVTTMRYWVDTFVSKADTILLNTPAEQAFILEQLNFSNYDTGEHYIYMQFKDAANYWSSVVVDSFYQIGRPRIDSHTPKVGGNTGSITITIHGNGFINKTGVKLTRTGKPDIVVPDSMIVINRGKQIKATVNLSGKDTGLYNLVVSVPNDTVMTVSNGFKIETGMYGEIKTSIVGPQGIRLGGNFQFSVIATNTGNINRRMPIVNLYSFNQNPISVDVPQLAENFSVLPIGDMETIIAPGQTITYPIYSKANGSGSYGIYQMSDSKSNNYYETFSKTPFNDIASQPCETPTGQPAHCCPDGCSIPVKILADYLNANNEFKAACVNHDICYRSTQNFFIGRAICDGMLLQDLLKTCNCYYQIGSTDWALCVSKTAAIYTGVRLGGFDPYSKGQKKPTCIGPPKPLSSCPPPQDCPQLKIPDNDYTQDCYAPTVAAAYDPNAKYGPQGNGIDNYVSNFTFPYLITYENDKAATAWAQTVRIVDTLDTTVVDKNSFVLGFIQLADSVINIPNGKKQHKMYIDMRPHGNDVIVQLNAGINDTTGVATWLFETLDPETMEPTTDPLAGFVPPNIKAPEGEGGVFFTVKLKDGVANNTLVSNKAYIYFDYNAPIATDAWKNTIDNIQPHSNVTPLPTFVADTVINVSWKGTDTSSGVMYYTVYVSENGKPYEVWRYRIGNTADTFIGKTDSTYAFYSVATDTAGNVEEVPNNYDAITKLVPVSVTSLDKEDGNIALYPNPTDGTFTIEGKVEADRPFTVSVYNVLGQKILSETVTVNNGNFRRKLNIRPQPSGQYSVVLTGDNWNKVYKLNKL